MYIDAHGHYTLMHKDAYPFRDQKYILRCTMKQFKEVVQKKKKKKTIQRKNVSVYQT